MTTHSRQRGQGAADVYEYILVYKTANDGIAPSIQEIADHLHVVKSQAYYFVNQLIQKGLIKNIYRGGKRQIHVVGATWTPPSHGNTLHNLGYQNIQDFIKDRNSSNFA